MEACTVFFVILTGGLLFLKAGTQINLVPWVKPTQPSTLSNCCPSWTLRTFPSEGRWFPRRCERWNCFADRFLLEVGGWFLVGQGSWVNRRVLCCVCIVGSLEGTFSPAWCQVTPWSGLQKPVSCTKQRNHTQRWEKWDGGVWLSVSSAADTTVINYWFQTPVACIDGGTAVITLQQPQPAQTGLFFMPTRINHLLTVHKHTNNTSQGHLLIVNTH